MVKMKLSYFRQQILAIETVENCGASIAYFIGSQHNSSLEKTQ